MWKINLRKKNAMYTRNFVTWRNVGSMVMEDIFDVSTDINSLSLLCVRNNKSLSPHLSENIKESKRKLKIFVILGST